MNTSEELLSVWRRQVRIVEWVSSLITEETKDLRPAAESWTALRHLADIQLVRWEWIREISEAAAEGMKTGVDDDWETPISLAEIKAELAKSQAIIGDLLRSEAAATTPFGPYPSAFQFVQHMAFHDGWHVGLIMLALRRAGVELPADGEMENVWGSFWAVPELLPSV